MVFLHGGNYKSGACSGPVYNGQILAPTIDAVVVCIEYRVGAMGFLYLEEDPETGERIPGNFGIEDQIAALKFLWQNLESFGGDPNRITLTGQSAGAESISLLLTSSNHSELFSQAILFSDPFSLPLKTPSDSNTLGLSFASLLECEPASLSCLRTKSVDEIASATQESLSQLINHEKAFQLFQQWGPTVTEQPITSIEAGLNALKPIILGTCSEEGRIFVYEILPEPVSTASYNMFQNILVPGLSQEIQFFPPDPNVTDQRDVLSSMVTDYLFGCPTQYMAKLLIARGETRIYHYLFNHAFSFQHVWQQYKWCYGHVCHGCDVPFIFQSAILNNEEYSAEEKRFVSKYSSYLANFIHSGDPNHTGDGGQEGTDLTVWPKAGQVPGHLSTLILSADEDIRSVEDISSEKCQLFDRMGYTGVSNINKKNLNM
ncbi:hypothetical protein BSL78_11672 [Apostichopus japonicus]|uniref:Carboxylic ester hydrolase n=1 Tax=Stichopus japonicus TaxID=307972 RepID=A0A2G8KTU8_STIJA|nr:hypothetical protein BSL78_11672 [Apostichopus japonicus]